MLGRNGCRNHHWTMWGRSDQLVAEDERHCLNPGCHIGQFMCPATGHVVTYYHAPEKEVVNG